jgi:hypothetical protein
MNAPALLPIGRQRHDGWSPDRQRGFLAAIADGHTVEAAAHNVGMSATAAYSFRRRAPGAPFALGWSAANLLAREKLVATLWSRVHDGQVDTITRADGTTYTRHRFDNRLGSAMLTRADRYVDDPAQGPAVEAARLIAQEFDAYLDLIERDAGPARAGLFVAARAANAGELAPIAALARADLYCRTGVATADALAIADLDPAQRQDWTAEQWQRAEAVGLVILGPPAPAQDPELSQLWPEDDPENPVWWDEVDEHWRTRFPPPEGFAGEEEGAFGDEGYSRTLSPGEEAVQEAAYRAGTAERAAAEGRDRDLFFGFTPPAVPAATPDEACTPAAAKSAAAEPRARPCVEPASRAASRRGKGASRMSIFGSIKDAIFGHKAAAQAPAPAQASAQAPAQTPAQTPAMPQIQQPAAAQPAAAAPVDVENVLMVFETERGTADLNWRSSIVDLMKLLGLDSSLDNRKALATELGYTGATDGSAEMNIWLHKAVMQQLEKSGGKVPASLKD